MADNAEIDENRVPTLLGTSSTDGTPVTIYADPSTHRLLVNDINGGDVDGPASSTDNAIARFDGTTGKAIQNSAVTIDDSGNILTTGTNTAASFNPTGSTAPANGIYLSGANTLAFASNSTVRLTLSTTSLTSNTTINSSNANGYTLSATAPSSTNPVIIPNRSAMTTGFGAQASGNISGIIAGVEAVRWTSVGVEYPGGTPTHTITLGSAATGLALYNTADQTTNYERLTTSWVANVATISTEIGGTGTIRNLSIGTANRKFVIADGGSASGFYRFGNGTGTAGGAGVAMNGTWTASSGINPLVVLNSTITQSGTAGYTALWINPTESSTGSGAKLLIDAQLGGTSRFLVTSAGLVGIGTASPLTTLDVSGGVGSGIVTKTGNYTATDSDFTILCDATGGAITITLPAAAGATRRIYNIKKIDASINAVTIDGNASETIDGATTKVLATQYSTVTIQCDSNNWFII